MEKEKKVKKTFAVVSLTGMPGIPCFLGGIKIGKLVTASEI